MQHERDEGHQQKLMLATMWAQISDFHQQDEVCPGSMSNCSVCFWQTQTSSWDRCRPVLQFSGCSQPSLVHTR